MTRRSFRGFLAALFCLLAVHARAAEPIRFAVGPYLPTLSDTKKAFEPFFAFIAAKLGRPYTLVATDDWAGISVALANNQVDMALMGPWGYVLAHRKGGAEAIAMLKYQGKTTYRSIIVTRPDVTIKKWPQDAKNLRISFDDVGNTSGYLIPTYWFLKQGIDPKTYFRAYRDGAAPAANFVAVINGQTDLATGCDRCLDEYAAAGAFPLNAVKVVWRSAPLPNDAIAVRKGLDPKTVAALQAAVTSLTPEQAQSLLPKNYTGFAPATNADYAAIQDAGEALGFLPKDK